MLVCQNCNGTNDVTELYRGEEQLVLCADCRLMILVPRGTQRSTRPHPGRPSLGDTRKVSLTLPAATWEYLDSEAGGNRSEYLRKLIDRDMWTEQSWSNNACLGYAILGAQKLGYSEQQLKDLVRAIYGQFDWKSVEEAKTVYNESSY